MKECTKVCGRNEEIFIRNKKGSMIHLLPGESYAGESDEYTYIIPKKLEIILPVGAANEDNISGISWGGYCVLHCRLALPYRFMTKHGLELMGGQEIETILANTARAVLQEEMRKSAETVDEAMNDQDRQIMWEKIRNKIEKHLLLEGWIQTECRPGRFQIRRRYE